MEAWKKPVVSFLGQRKSRKMPPRNNKSIVLKHLSRFITKSISIAKTSTKPAINRRLFKLGKTDHYDNYRFLEEYQLSPKKTPPFLRFKSGSSSIVFFLCGCWPGRIKGCEDYDDGDFVGSSMNLLRELEPVVRDNGDDGSVDRRAEWFIAKFYQEMRMEISLDQQD